jgi:hypothetical protein
MLNKKIENIINEPTNYYQVTAPVRPNNEEEVNHPSTVVAETTVAIEEVDLNPSPIIAVQETTAPIEESIEELTQITLIMKQIENLLNPQQLKQISKMNVNDKISSPNATTLVRKIQITGAPESLYFQLASATQIELISKGLYAIGNKNYYISVEDSLNPVIRKSSSGQELIVAIPVNTASLSYSITW